MFLEDNAIQAIQLDGAENGITPRKPDLALYKGCQCHSKYNAQFPFQQNKGCYFKFDVC